MRKILIFLFAAFIFISFENRVLAQVPTPTPTITPTPTPADSRNICGGTCGSDGNCQTGLVCYQGNCRNPSCQSQINCVCQTSTPTPTQTASATKAPTVRPTIRPTATSATSATAVATTSPIPTEDATPTGSPSPVPVAAISKGTKLKNLAIGILAVGFFVIAGGLIYHLWKGKDKMHQITNP